RGVIEDTLIGQLPGHYYPAVWNCWICLSSVVRTRFGAACQPPLPQLIVTRMVGTLKFGRVRLKRLARRGVPVLLTSGMLAGMLAGLAAAAAPAALPAFDISPASLTMQAGDTATGTLSNLPVPTDGRLG